jgi:hypothetical protein
MKMIGQSSTPAVKLNDPVWPNRLHPNGGRPSVVSSAKIFTPTNSATIALPTKKAVRPRNSRVERASSSDAVIGRSSCRAMPAGW